MAGIAGVVYPDIFQTRRLVETMLGIVEHRGHNRQDIQRFKNIEIGICGAPCAHGEHSDVSIFLDGDIYNTAELLEALKKAGLKIKNNNDADILVYAYEHWGIDFIKKLNGSFAIALLDRKEQSLFIIKDRLGKKPLYWAEHNKHFLFSSELKSILSTGVLPQTPAEDALAAYFFLGYIPQDMTLIKNANKLLPGYYLQHKLDGRTSIHSYWSYSSYFNEKSEISPEESSQLLDSLLQDSVHKRIKTDSPLACSLGGGLGSATIAYYLNKNGNKQDLQTVTTYYEGENESDFEAASSVSNSLGLRQHHHCIKHDTLLNDLINIVWHLDEPIADPSIVQTWHQCALAKTIGTTIYSGMGCDEITGGHLRYLLKAGAIQPLSWLHSLPHTMIHKALLPFIKLFNIRSSYKLLRKYNAPPQKLSFLRYNSIFTEREISHLSPNISGYFHASIFLQKFYRMTAWDSNVEAFLYFDVKTALADKCLLQFERLSAAHGLEWRAPFLDHRLVEFFASLPHNFKTNEVDTAILLRRLMNTRFSSDFIHREKKTRKTFLDSWLTDKSLVAALELLKNGILVETGYLSQKWVINFINKVLVERRYFLQAWSLLILEIWFHLYIGRPVSSLPNTTSIAAMMSRRN